ncbi:MAG: response regulator, partial [Spirochaetota bacterium]
MTEQARNAEKKKILLVEDEAIIAIDQARVIEEFGYRVVTAYNGEEAVDVISADREIELVLMDIDLGSKIDGTEATRRILEIRALPVVFLTSHAEKEMVDRVKNITRYGYVLKNSGKFVLNEAITMAFDLFEAHNEAQKSREEVEVTNEELRVAIEEMEATNEEFEAANEELLNSEKELWESREKFRELFENMGNGVAIYEAVNDGADFVIVNFNKAAERIENIHREEVIGRSVLDAFPGVKEFGLFKVFQRVWKSGQPERFPVSQYRDGRISGWRDNYVYRLPSGELVAVYEDVTAGKQAEEQLVHQQQMT